MPHAAGQPFPLHAALLSSYALYSCYKHRRPGHLFQGRFKAKLVEGEVYLLAVTRYIHLNPIKIAACRRLTAEQRLARLEAYPWSSYGGYAAAAQAQEFVNYEVLREYGRDLAAARRPYRAYVRACLLEDDGPLLEAMAASRYAIGGAAFVERAEERIEGRRSGRVQDQALGDSSLRPGLSPLRVCPAKASDAIACSRTA